jgi:hypothetical protein
MSFERSVPYLETDDPDVILGAVFGEDGADARRQRHPGISRRSIVGAIDNIGRLAACGVQRHATSSVPPR